MKTLILGWMVVGCWGLTTAQARLGETEAEAQKRYGPPQTNEVIQALPPLLPGAVEHAYLYDGWLVRAAYLEGRTEMISYQHSTGRAIGETEVTTILEAERGERIWKDPLKKERREKDSLTTLATAVMEATQGRVWERGDRARACLQPDARVLLFETRKAVLHAQKFERGTKPAKSEPPAKSKF
jgi:hypothetical protein